MLPLHSLVLGLVQGLSEFLPISSSVHLIIVPYVLGWPAQPLAFDLVLHLGTLLALVIFFWKDLWTIFSSLLHDIFEQRLHFKNYSKNSILGLIVLVATIPANVIGLLFSDFIENNLRNVVYDFWFLILGTVLLFVAEKFFSKVRESNLVEKITFGKGFIIGIFQTLALMPGVSRSGSTISAGMFTGFSREDAARFSFLVSVPIVFEAALFELLNSADKLSTISVTPMILGLLASFVSGIICIKFLLDFVKNKSLYVFVIYRILLILFLAIFMLR